MSTQSTKAMQRTLRVAEDSGDILLIERTKYPGSKWMEDRVIITREELKKMAAKYLGSK